MKKILEKISDIIDDISNPHFMVMLLFSFFIAVSGFYLFEELKYDRLESNYIKYYDATETKEFILTNEDYKKILNTGDDSVTLRLRDGKTDDFIKCDIKLGNTIKNTSMTNPKKALLKVYKRNSKKFKLYLYKSNFELPEEYYELEKIVD